MLLRLQRNVYICNYNQELYTQMNGKSSYELPNLTQSMGAHLGIQFLEMEEGYVKAQMPVDERTCQPFGILNGGASLALAEIVAGHGSIPLCSANEMPCGIQVSANHLQMVPKGEFVIATGRLIHRGCTSHLWNVDITNQEGKLISTARIVNQIVKKRP